MKLKFPDLTMIHAQIENPTKLKFRAKEISQIATKLLKRIEEPRLFGRLKERILEVWRA